MKLLLARALIRLSSLLPIPAVYYLAVPLGWLGMLVPWRKRRIIRRNLELCFPDLSAAQRRAMERANLTEMLRLALESGAVWYWDGAKLKRHVRTVEGWPHVEDALAAGRGVLFLGAHLGNWELVSLYGSMRMPVAYLYQPPRDPAVDRALKENRGRFGGEFIASGTPAMRTILRQLRRGGAVGLLCDQQPRRGEGVFAPFFGQPALTMTLVNRITRQTGCAVIFGHCLRLDRGRGWKIVIQPAGSRIAAAESVEACTELNRMVEKGVRLAPEQYLWMYKRFDLQPAGRANPYHEMGS